MLSVSQSFGAPMDPSPIRKLEQAAPLTNEERAAIVPLLRDEITFPAGADIAVDGTQPTFSTVLLEGWAWRYRLLEDGRRQILSIQVPGDWTDLHSYFINTLDHSVGAVTACRVAKISHGKLRTLICDHPRFAQILWRDTAIEAAVHREWIVDLGARRADERLAHFICEVWSRLCAVGLNDGSSIAFPFTQQALADIIGLTPVHTNRVVRGLTRQGVVEFSRGACSILDLERLRAQAGFNGRYLHLDEGPPVDGPLA